jgi:hypothetical protein
MNAASSCQAWRNGLVGLVEGEDVYQYDRAGLDRDLACDRKSGIKRAHERHNGSCSVWLYDVNLV